MAKRVFVSGCYDLLHSGHVEFFRQAAEYGDLYVGIGSDATILGYKHHKTVYSEQERLFMVKSIRYVKDAYINAGSGVLDFLPTLDIVKPDILVVNEDGGSPEKEAVCLERGMEYVVLRREPQPGLAARSSTALKRTDSQVPTRLDLAGTWIDQPYVSCFAPGWALTISLEPTFEIRERCGLWPMRPTAAGPPLSPGTCPLSPRLTAIPSRPRWPCSRRWCKDACPNTSSSTGIKCWPIRCPGPGVGDTWRAWWRMREPSHRPARRRSG